MYFILSVKQALQFPVQNYSLQRFIATVVIHLITKSNVLLCDDCHKWQHLGEVV